MSQYECPDCGETSESPEAESVTGGSKLTCRKCGATDFQPEWGAF